MCGLYGYCSTNPTTRLAHMVTALGLYNEARGNEATGLGLINKKADIVKAAVPAHEFFRLPAVQHDLKRAHQIVIGHTRLATSGPKTTVGAHPYRYGPITGAHNGIVYNCDKVHPDGLVDSEAAFFALSQVSPSRAPEALLELDGLITLSWHDSRLKNRVRLFTNNTSLYLAWWPAHKAWVWSSEKMGLRVSIAAASGDTPDILELVDDTIYTLGPGHQLATVDAPTSTVWTYNSAFGGGVDPLNVDEDGDLEPLGLPSGRANRGSVHNMTNTEWENWEVYGIRPAWWDPEEDEDGVEVEYDYDGRELNSLKRDHRRAATVAAQKIQLR